MSINEILKDKDIQKDIIEPINRKDIKTKDMAIQLNISEKELKEYIKENGYKWRGSTYKKDNEEQTEAKKEIIEKVKVTYRIDKQLQRLVKIQSIIEDTEQGTIIERAIKKYVYDEAYKMNEQIEKIKK